MQQRIG